MNRIATLLLLTACWLWPAEAQPVRNGQDVLWARDVAGASMTFDGALDEPAWQQAERIHVSVAEQTYFTPGGGWQYQENDAATDPADADVYFLRDGNTLWIGVDARDRSVGGTADFFVHDGIVMSIVDKNNPTENGFLVGDTWVRDNYGPHEWADEFFYTWINRPEWGIEDSVGMAPTFLGNESAGGMPNAGVWDGRTVVDGLANDDFNGNAEPTPDVGYTMEIWIDLDSLGYDMSAADGDAVGLTFGIYDLDYQWPIGAGAGDRARTRAWWQNPWGGDQPWGNGRIYGRADVTVSSGPAPELSEPDVRLAGVPGGATITVDGMMDEGIWAQLDPVMELQYKMSPEMIEMLPGYGSYYTGWFRPGGGDGAPTVIDPSIGTFKMFYQGSTVYIGLETNDAAISGQTDENRADGFRFMLRDLGADSVAARGSQFPGLEFMVVIDSTGAARPLQGSIDNPAITVGASPKAGSTPADPTDVDGGYYIEMAVDLAAMGYPLAEYNNQIWFSMNYFDGDDLEVVEDSYGTRTWFLGERAGNMQGARTYLDPELIVANEGGASLPTALTLAGNAPNPFRGETELRYALPATGAVTLRVYDVLGREVAVVDAGVQAAGPAAVRFDGRGLASGVYLYRVELEREGAAQASATGRMLLVK